MGEDEYRNKTIDYAEPLSVEDIANRRHRRRVGRKWALMGPMQRDFLIAHGLDPGHRLLDVGCGPLRAGIHFVEYLQPGHYYGIDINETLLEAGYEREMPTRLRERLPRDHLRATDRFDCDFGVTFDYAIAQSVFTHVSLNHIRLCLYRVAQQMEPGGRFFATFFEAPPWHPLDQSLNSGRRWTERNAFFYYRSDLKWAARCADWNVHYIGRWGHPGGQRIVEFRRTKPKATQRALVERAARSLSPRVKRPIKRALKGRM
jgi:SAM-dependent methyltransferase